jgi:hypothetical protein
MTLLENSYIDPNGELSDNGFEKGLKEIRAFYPSFKLDAEAKAAWAKRLRRYKILNKGWLKAVDWAIEAGLDKTPTFFTLKNKSIVLSKSEDQRREGLPVCEPSGWAVMSDKKMEVSAAFMKELRLAMENKTIKDPECKKHLISTWRSAYRSLPMYHTEDQIKALIKSKNRGKLDALGFTDEGSSYVNLPDS